MKAAVVRSFEQPPSYQNFPDPTPQEGETLISVSAAALSPLVKSQAGGSHYSSKAEFPFIPGVDGVGKLPDGQRVYFAFPKRPYGSMAQFVAANNGFFVPIPDEVDDVTAAAIANPGMSSWAALTRRAKFVAGETVLINGATGNAGQLAIQIAKHLGAKKVIATGRNRAVLDTLPALGADEIIVLEGSAEEQTEAFRKTLRDGIDVVLDYLWGSSAEQLIAAISGHADKPEEPRLRFVQIGSISGGNITLPSSVLRSSGLELMGSGLGSVSYRELVAAIGELMRAVQPAGLQVETEAVALAEVESAWSRDTSGRRLVFKV